MSSPETAAAPAHGLGREAVGGVLLVLAGIQFGIVVVLGKLALQASLPVFGLLAWRFGVAAVLLAVLLAVLGQPLAAARGERRGLAAVGAVGYAAESAFFFAALRHGTAAAVTLLFFTYPVIVVLATWAMGRGRPNRLTAMALGGAVSGATLVVTSGGGLAVRSLGIAFALGSATTYTAYLIAAEHVLKRTKALTGAMWQAAGASLGLVVYGLATGTLVRPEGWSAWGPILGMGVATAGAFVCLLEGLRRLGPVRTSIISAIEPLAAAILGVVVLGESVGLGVAGGGLLIVGGAVAASLARAGAVAEPTVP